jgi:hypothetical protein
MDDNTDHDNCMSVLTPTDVMYRGLQYCGLEYGQQKAVTDENVVSAETAIQVYKAHRLEAFADVGFDQFKLRLKDHRDQVSKLHAASRRFAMGGSCLPARSCTRGTSRNSQPSWRANLR